MKVIFFGTPEYVVPTLKELHKPHEVVAVVTQPPKLVGREQFKKYSPVDNWAHKRNVAIFFDFEKPLPEAEFGVCAAYGTIIPKSVIGHFPLGILNIHPSLLPKYRGASPVQATIANGDVLTGVTIIKMDETMDHGPIVTQFKEDVLPSDSTESLRSRLFERAAQALIELLPNYIKGKVKPKEQNHEEATFTKILKKEDGYIDLRKSKPEDVERFIRAMYPWPCAWTRLPDGRRLKLLPNDIVQLEGKNPVTKKQFKEAYGNTLF